MTSIWMVIIGMMVVTYIPRVLPFFAFSGKKLPKQIEAFLAYVPYTALGALLIPGSVMAIEGHPLISVAGIGFATLYSIFRGGMIVTIIGSMGIVYLLLLIT